MKEDFDTKVVHLETKVARLEARVERQESIIAALMKNEKNKKLSSQSGIGRIRVHITRFFKEPLPN
jgi:hypothetical protein